MEIKEETSNIDKNESLSNTFWISPIVHECDLGNCEWQSIKTITNDPE